MYQKFFIFFIFLLTIFLFSSIGCNVTVTVEPTTTTTTIRVNGWVANIDSFKDSLSPDTIKVKNGMGETIYVKYKFDLTTDSVPFDSSKEPNWETDLAVKKEILLSSTNPALEEVVDLSGKFEGKAKAIVWLYIYNEKKDKYLKASFVLFDSDNMEIDIAIKPETK